MYGRSIRQFLQDLKGKIQEDDVANGAAALAFYLMLAIFPAMIFLLSILPYLPIADLDRLVMDLLRQALPGEAAALFSGTVEQVVTRRRGGLLSFGLLLTLWAASSGMFAVMKQLNLTYGVKEGRPFWKTRGTAVLLTILFGALIIGAFALIVLGGRIQGFLGQNLGWGQPLLILFAVFRWAVIGAAILMAFAVAYYFGPDVERKFRLITPGSVAGALVLTAVSLAFKFYVDNFGKYEATYGSLGAVIVLMLWLNVTGLVILLGSEVNALVEHAGRQGRRGDCTAGDHMNPESGKSNNPSIASSLREVGSSAKEMISSEVNLIGAELQNSVQSVRSHVVQAAIFGALTAISALPFVAFLVIGLGRILGDNYWLSSLIVSAFCALTGGSMAYRAYGKIASEDLTLPRSREGLEREREAVSEKIREMKQVNRRSA